MYRKDTIKKELSKINELLKKEGLLQLLIIDPKRIKARKIKNIKSNGMALLYMSEIVAEHLKKENNES